MIVPRDASLLWKFFHFLITLLRPLLCKLQVENREYVPEQGGGVLVCNHTGTPDFIVMGYASPRQIYFMAKSEIFGWHPWLTKIIVSAGAFPVRRGQSDVGAIQGAIELVRSGHIVGIFPEGTRSPTAQLQRGRTGAARIALHAQAPVVPMIVLNAPQILHRGKRFWQRPTVTVRFGKPLTLSGDPADPQSAQAATEQIMHAMAALLPISLRGEYAGEETVATDLETSKENGLNRTA